MIRSLVVASIFLSGCFPEPTQPSSLPGYGAVRERLFVQCMKLAKDTVKAGHYNDSAEVIDECSLQAYYMANSYKGDGYRGVPTEQGSKE